MVDPIRRVLVKQPRDAYQSQSQVDEQSPLLNYFGTPDFDKAQAAHESLVAFLESSGAEVHYLPKDNSTSLDSVYTHDPCVVTNGGIVLCTMGKVARCTDFGAD